MRRVRKKFEDTATLSITSLLDVLTIVLVFLIKNVSMEAQKITVPANMTLPVSITNQELIENGLTVLIQVYEDKVLVGTDNLKAGSLQDLVENQKTRTVISEYMKNEATQVEKRNERLGTIFQPCLLIQAHDKILCQFITEVVKIGAGAGFANIYFSTLQNQTWLQESAVRLQ